MPQFVQSVANQQMPPPYFFPNVTAHTFCFEVPMASVQQLCDRYFNLGEPRERGFRYRCLPVLPYGMLMVLQYPVMITKERLDLDEELPLLKRGYAQQNEVFVAFPVVRHGTRLANFVSRAAVEWTLPFIAVDNSTSAFSGREILGLDKLYADIAIATGEYLKGFSVDVTVPGWPSIDPQAVQQNLPFLSISTGPPTPYPSPSVGQTSPFTLLKSQFARRSLEQMAALADGLETLSAGAIPTSMRIVALKQIRDAQDPHSAVYRALVGARTRYSNISDLQFFNENDVQITFHDNGSLSEIVGTILGAPARDPTAPQGGSPISVVAKAACSFKADIDFDEMTTLHSFPVDTDKDRPAGTADDAMLAPWLRPWSGLWKTPAKRGAP